MGICQSSDSVYTNTAKVVMADGKLAEFQQPSRVWEVVKSSPGCFVCDADDLDFGGEVVGLSDDEELLSGQLYFALPMSWLGRVMEAEEMAALAVKASSALGKARVARPKSGGCCGSSAVVPSGAGDRRRSGGGRGRSRVGKGMGRSFELKLSAIPE